MTGRHGGRGSRRDRLNAGSGISWIPAALLSVALAVTLPSPAAEAKGDAPSTRRARVYANPIDLPYRYQKLVKTHREAADPTLIRFEGRYWLFASHSKGYWHSQDLLHWTFVEPTGFDVDKFAPTVLAMDGKLYLAASEHARKIWVTDDPLKGVWREAADISGYDDPCLFLDDDGRLYMYEGLSGTTPLRALELDAKTFQPVREATIPKSRGKETRGWEVVGDNNERPSAPTYVEGAWMTKHAGRYYLQYAAPGTEFKTYADGVLVAQSPMGPFEYESYSPFSFKPTGFIAGAGHGSTMQAGDGRWWHAGTMSISKRFRFERRLGLFPAGFTRRGELFADTYLGDYPRYIDGSRQLTGWMLLSRKKAVTASSTLPGFPVELAADEDVRTWWSAASGGDSEWYQMDLGASKRVDALQINFADQDSRGTGISEDTYRYEIDVSGDARNWRTVVDASKTGRDAPHDLQVLARPVQARYVRVRNIHSPDGGKFSLFDLRVFGNGGGRPPSAVTSAAGVRDKSDPRKARLSWKPSSNADFYVVRLGVRPDLLTQNYQVYDAKITLDVASLNSDSLYYFAVDAVNENGIRPGKPVRVGQGTP